LAGGVLLYNDIGQTYSNRSVPGWSSATQINQALSLDDKEKCFPLMGKMTCVQSE